MVLRFMNSLTPPGFPPPLKTTVARFSPSFNLADSATLENAHEALFPPGLAVVEAVPALTGQAFCTENLQFASSICFYQRREVMCYSPLISIQGPSLCRMALIERKARCLPVHYEVAPMLPDLESHGLGCQASCWQWYN